MKWMVMWAAVGAIVVLLVGCSSSKDTVPVVEVGKDVCAECRMTVSDPAYAAVIRPVKGNDLVFDAVECLIRYRRRPQAEAGEVWLADVEDGTLGLADNMSVVLADFPSPMGGGYAAFRDADRARAAAQARDGVVAPLDEFISGTASRARTAP